MLNVNPGGRVNIKQQIMGWLECMMMSDSVLYHGYTWSVQASNVPWHCCYLKSSRVEGTQSTVQVTVPRWVGLTFVFSYC